MHPHFCQCLEFLEQFVTDPLDSSPSPAKFQLSTLCFVLPPNYLVSSTERLWDIIFPEGPDHIFFGKSYGRHYAVKSLGWTLEICTKWDRDTYHVLEFFSEHAIKVHHLNGNEVHKGRRGIRTSPGIELLDVHYGHVEVTRKCVPEDVLSHRLSCVAITFYQYLCDFSSAWKNLAKPEGLHIMARKSVHRPWLTRQQTGRNLGRQSFLQRLQGEIPPYEYKALQPPHISAYMKLAWTLKILHCVVLMAKNQTIS